MKTLEITEAPTYQFLIKLGRITPIFKQNYQEFEKKDKNYNLNNQSLKKKR